MADEGSVEDGMEGMDKGTKLILDGLFNGVEQVSSADLEVELGLATKANKFMEIEDTVKEKPPTLLNVVVEEVIQAAPLIQEKIREAEQPKIEKKISRPSRNPYARRNPYAARAA